MSQNEDPENPENPEESSGSKLPMFWTPDGHNLWPTTAKAWIVVAIGAVGVGVLVAWLSGGL